MTGQDDFTPRHEAQDKNNTYATKGKARHKAQNPLALAMMAGKPYKIMLASVLSIASISGLVAINNNVTRANNPLMKVAQAAPVNDTTVSRGYYRESLASTKNTGGKWELGEDQNEISQNLLNSAKEQTEKLEQKKKYEDYGKTYEDIIANAKNDKSKAAQLSTTGYAYIDKVPLKLTNDIAIASYNNAKKPDGFNSNHATGDNNGNAYPWSQCTWWSYKRRHDLGLPAGSHFGDGRMWGDSARSLGYWVDNTPMVGDVISFDRGEAGADGYYGHVAVVEYVSPIDGSVITSESGASLNGDYQSRIFTKEEASKYDYIHL